MIEHLKNLTLENWATLLALLGVPSIIGTIVSIVSLVKWCVRHVTPKYKYASSRKEYSKLIKNTSSLLDNIGSVRYIDERYADIAKYLQKIEDSIQEIKKYHTPVSKFLGVHIPLKKPIIPARMNQAWIFCHFGRHPLKPQKYSHHFNVSKCCKSPHNLLNS